MDDVTRRSLFRILAVSAAAGTIEVPAALAQHVHVALAEAKSLSGGPNYQPKYFNAHDYATLKKLADLIIPADEHSGGALEAGAPEYIDFLTANSPELAAIFNGGLTWVDQTMHSRYGTHFVASRPEQQTALLDSLAWRRNVTPETAYGVRFWTMLRNMVVDAYYTSPTGVKDLGYMGNTAVAKFQVPEEAVRYAISRSPFAND